MDLTNQDHFYTANSAIFHVLPAVSPGLLIRRHLVDDIAQFINTQCSRLRHDLTRAQRLRAIEKQLPATATTSKLAVDTAKTVVLASAFGDIYTPALALLTNGHLHAEWWGQDPKPHWLKLYLFEGQKQTPVFLRAKLHAEVVAPSLALEVDPFLNIKRMLESLGEESYTLDLQTFRVVRYAKLPELARKTELGERASSIEKTELVPEAEISHPADTTCLPGDSNIHSGETSSLPDDTYVHVDVYAWYCSCERFFDRQQLPKVTPEALLNFDHKHVPAFLLGYFQNQHLRYSNPLPLCEHLLAYLLLVFNWDEEHLVACHVIPPEASPLLDLLL